MSRKRSEFAVLLEIEVKVDLEVAKKRGIKIQNRKIDKI